MLTLVAGSGFAPQFAGRAPAPVLPRAAAPQLQDVAIKDESDSGFQFESNSDDVHEQHKELESVGLPAERFSLDAPLVAHDLVESLISGGDEPGQALADVILATQISDTDILEDVPAAQPEFFFETEEEPSAAHDGFASAEASATPLVAPIDPLTGELPEGIELPVALPHVEATAPPLELPLFTEQHSGSSQTSDDVAVAASPASEDTAPTAPTVELPTLRELGLFCLPTLGIWLSSPLLSLIDTSVVGLTSSTFHLAALAPSTKLCDYVAFFCSVIGAATTNLAADAFAREDPTRAKRIIGSSLSISLMLGSAVALALGVAARPLMGAMLGGASTANPVVLTAASQYTAIRALGYPAALLTFVLQSAFIAAKDSRSPLLAVPLAATVNLIADFALVPSMGAAGAAWATTLALCTNAVTLLYLWARKARTIASQQVNLLTAPSADEFKAMLAFAAPMMVALIARVSMGLSITLSAVALGTTALAANQIIESLYWLFCPFGEAISLCMQAYLPPLLLHGRSLARRLQGQAMRAAGVLGVVAASAAYALPVFLPGLFTSSATVVGAMGAAAPMLGFTLLSYVLFCATEGMLIARKQLRFLATAHVSSAILFAAALRAAISRPLCKLTTVWAIFGGMQIARMVGFRIGLAVDDRNHLEMRKEDPFAFGRDSPRWHNALRALRGRVHLLRDTRREKIHQLVPPVEQIAPHLLGPDPGQQQ